MLSADPSRKNFKLMIRFATDNPVGGLDHSFPVHPDHGSSKPMEYWEEQLHKRKPGKRTPQNPPEKPRDPSRQIDDFA